MMVVHCPGRAVALNRVSGTTCGRQPLARLGWPPARLQTRRGLDKDSRKVMQSPLPTSTATSSAAVPTRAEPAPEISPEISIVLPALNEAANLPAMFERLAAVLGHVPYEVIVVDDGSTD